MSELNFELDIPIWSVEIHYNGSPGILFFNVQADTEEKAIEQSVDLFSKESLNPVLIYRIEVSELKRLT